MQATVGPFPRENAAQPSLRVVQGSIMWRQRVRSTFEVEMEGFGVEMPF
jgi:hypothetical protein